MKHCLKLLLGSLFSTLLLCGVHAAEPDGSWLDISLIQPHPYANWALLVINQGYNASKQKRVELPYNFAEHAEADLLLDERAEYKLGDQLSRSLVIKTIEIRDVESVKLLPRYFKNLPQNYAFKKTLIAHKRKTE